VFTKQSNEGRDIIFSSLVKFRNTLSKPLLLISLHQRKEYHVIATLKKRGTVAFPVTSPQTLTLALTDNLNLLTGITHGEFTISSVRKEARVINCFIRHGTFRLLLTPKRNWSSSVLRISVEAPTIAINRLPCAIRMTFGDKPKQLPINRPVNLTKVQYGKQFAATISRTGRWGRLGTIKTAPDETSQISQELEGDLSLAVYAAKREDSPQISLVFYAPTIIFNRTSQRLLVTDVSGGERYSFEPRVEGVSPDDDGLLLWGRSSFFGDSRSMKICVVLPSTETGTETVSEPIECLSLSTDNTLELPHP
jgi:hypothetical protein